MEGIELEAIYLVSLIGYVIITAIIVYRLFKTNKDNAVLILISIILLIMTKGFYLITTIGYVIVIILIIVNYKKRDK